MEKQELVKWKDLPLSKEGQAALVALKKGQVLAVRMRHVANGKVQIEFAEKINTPDPIKNAVSLLNKSDDRFNFTSGAKRCWTTAEPVDAKEVFGFEIPEGESSIELLEVIQPYEGMDFRIRVNEVVEADLTENQKKYSDNYLKRAGKEGRFFYTKDGQRVAQIATLVTAPIGTEIEHVYLEGSYLTDETGKEAAVGSTKRISVVS